MPRISRAKIINGVWTRKVPTGWSQHGLWRTAIDKSALADPRLRECRFVKGDSIVLISAEELRRVVVGGPEYDKGRKWGPFNLDPNNRTVAGHILQMIVLHKNDFVPKDTEQLLELKRVLDELQAVPQIPETLRKIQRVLKTYERPSAITRSVKKTRGATCELCGELGFVKRNGLRYCEVHHLFHLSKNPPAKCLTPEYLVVLCATCHCRMHYCDVGEPLRDVDGWHISIDGKEHLFRGHWTA